MANLHSSAAGNLLRGTARLFLRYRYLETTNIPGRKHAFLPPVDGAGANFS